MATEKREKFCPQCNSFAENGAKYCGQCGFNLAGFYASPERVMEAARERERRQEFGAAAQLYRYGSRCGHAECMYGLGVLFEKGSGVKPNAEKALYCHQRAAERSYLPSVLWLRRAYAGEIAGIEPDGEKEKSCLKIAAELGDEKSREELAFLAEDSAPEEDEQGGEESLPEEFDLSQGTITDMQGKFLRRTFEAARRLREANADKNAVRQEEEEHLAFLRGRMQQKIGELAPEAQIPHDLKDVRDAADLRVFQAEKERAMSRLEKIEFLKAHLGSPYFGRMLLESGGEMLDLYIGQDHFILDSDDRLEVFSHNSDVPAHIYDRSTQFSYKNIEYTVLFKRNFDIADGKLRGVFQTYLRGKGQDDIVYDKFLASILERKKNDKRLTDIIPTIQENQNQIITRPREENLIVQGCAGCGKTMILLQRLEYLVFRGEVSPDKVTVLVPGEEFKRHIAPVVRDLHLQQIKIRTVSEFYLDVLSRYLNAQAVEKLRAQTKKQQNGGGKIDDYYYSGDFSATLRERIRKESAKWADEVRDFEELQRAYAEEQADFANRKEWIRSSFCSRCAASRLMPAPLAYLRKRYCARCQKVDRPVAFDFRNISAPERPTLSLSRYDALYKGDGKEAEHSRSELYAETLMQFLFGGAKKLTKNNYEGDLVCIDEGQDLNPSEYALLRAVCGRKATFNVYGDIDQRLDPKRGVGAWTRLEHIGSFSYYELNENYRNTQEVTAFINENLQKNIAALGLDGAKVLTVKESEIKQHLAYQADGARVAIIVGENNAAARERLERDAELCGYVRTVGQCKGLEFDAAFVFHGDMTYHERYIAYSRSLGSLYLVEP